MFWGRGRDGVYELEVDTDIFFYLERRRKKNNFNVVLFVFMKK